MKGCSATHCVAKTGQLAEKLSTTQRLTLFTGYKMHEEVNLSCNISYARDGFKTIIRYGFVIGNTV
jgi:hypothetical protein